MNRAELRAPLDFELVFHHAIMMHYPAFEAEQKHYAACKPQKITIVIMIYYYAPSGVANRYSRDSSLMCIAGSLSRYIFLGG